MFLLFTMFKGSLLKISAPVKRKVLFPKFRLTFGRDSLILCSIISIDKKKISSGTQGRACWKFAIFVCKLSINLSDFKHMQDKNWENY